MWKSCKIQQTSISQMSIAWRYKIIFEQNRPFGVRDGKVKLNETENKMFTDLTSDFTLQLYFKELLLGNFWHDIKEDHSQLQKGY